MTLSDFREMTRHLSGDLDVKIMAPWGEIEDAELVTIDDLTKDDPAREQLLNAGDVVVLTAAQPA